MLLSLLALALAEDPAPATPVQWECTTIPILASGGLIAKPDATVLSNMNSTVLPAGWTPMGAVMLSMASGATLPGVLICREKR